VTTDSRQMLRHYDPSRLQMRLMRIGLRRFRWFRRWLGGVWRKRHGAWLHHLELSPMELLAIFPMVAFAEARQRVGDLGDNALVAAGRDIELWTLPVGELPQARAIRMSAAADRDAPPRSDPAPR
jgi:hypothetical protein